MLALTGMMLGAFIVLAGQLSLTAGVLGLVVCAVLWTLLMGWLRNGSRITLPQMPKMQMPSRRPSPAVVIVRAETTEYVVPESRPGVSLPIVLIGLALGVLAGILLSRALPQVATPWLLVMGIVLLAGAVIAGLAASQTQTAEQTELLIGMAAFAGSLAVFAFTRFAGIAANLSARRKLG